MVGLIARSNVSKTFNASDPKTISQVRNTVAWTPRRNIQIVIHTPCSVDEF